MPRRRRLVWPLSGAALCVVAAAIPAGAAWAALGATTKNNADKFSAGTVQLQGQTPTNVDCNSTASGSKVNAADTAICPGDPLPSSQLSTTASSATSTLTSLGTLSPSSATVSSSSCGVEEVADTSTAANTGLVYGGVTYGTAFTSPVNSGFTSTGVTLDGAPATYIGTTVQRTDPSPFSVAAWVKTSVSGSIIGFTNLQSNAAPGANDNDRMLWVDSSGVVVFGVRTTGGTATEIQSTTKVNDGAWHFVVATLGATGMILYVDGTAQTGNNTSVTSAENYNGYWHLGWLSTTGWTDPPTTVTLTGSLAEVAVFSTALTQTNVNTLDGAASASAYATGVKNISGSAPYWKLADTGTVPYTGNLPAVGAPACSQVAADIQTTQGATTACAFPSGAGACAATPSTLLSTLTSSSMAAATNGSPVTVLIRMDLPTASVAGVLGLHVLANLGFAVTLGSWSATVTYPSASVEM